MYIDAPKTTSTPLPKERLLDADELFTMMLEDVNLYRTKDPILAGVSAVRQLIDRVDMCFRFMEGSDFLDESKFQTLQLIRKRLTEIHGNLSDDTLDQFWEDESSATFEEWLHSSTGIPFRDPVKPIIGSGNDSVVLKRMVADKITRLRNMGPLEFGQGEIWRLVDRIEICERYLREGDEDFKALRIVLDDLLMILNMRESHEVMACWESIDFTKWILKCVVEASVHDLQKSYSSTEIEQDKESYEEHWKKKIVGLPNFFPPVMTQSYPPLPFAQFSKNTPRSSPSPLQETSLDKPTDSLLCLPESNNVNVSASPDETTHEPSFPCRKVIHRKLTKPVPNLKDKPLLASPQQPLVQVENNASHTSKPATKKKSSLKKRKVIILEPEQKIQNALCPEPKKKNSNRRVVLIEPERKRKRRMSPATLPLLPLPEVLKSTSAPTNSAIIASPTKDLVETEISNIDPDTTLIDSPLSKIDLKLKLFNCIRLYRNKFERDISAKKPPNSPSPWNIQVPTEMLVRLKFGILSLLSTTFRMIDGSNERLVKVSLTCVIKKLSQLKLSLKKTLDTFLNELLNVVKSSFKAKKNEEAKRFNKLYARLMKCPKKRVRTVYRSLTQLLTAIELFEQPDLFGNPQLDIKKESLKIENFFESLSQICNCFIISVEPKKWRSLCIASRC